MPDKAPPGVTLRGAYGRVGLLLLCGLCMAACGDSGRADEISVPASFSIAADHASVSAWPLPDYIYFRRDDGTRIDLELGLVNLVPVQLSACPTMTAALRTLGDAMLGAAWAAQSASAAGGHLDALNGDPQALGALPVIAQQYCSMRLVMESKTALLAKHGDVHNATLDGLAMNIAYCYYPATAGMSDQEYDLGDYTTEEGNHVCEQLKLTLDDAVVLTLDFPSPLEVSQDMQQIGLNLRAYPQVWFDGIVLSDLGSSADEQSRFVDNILASIQIDAVAGQ